MSVLSFFKSSYSDSFNKTITKFIVAFLIVNIITTMIVVAKIYIENSMLESRYEVNKNKTNYFYKLTSYTDKKITELESDPDPIPEPVFDIEKYIVEYEDKYGKKPSTEEMLKVIPTGEGLLNFSIIKQFSETERNAINKGYKALHTGVGSLIFYTIRNENNIINIETRITGSIYYKKSLYETKLEQKYIPSDFELNPSGNFNNYEPGKYIVNEVREIIPRKKPMDSYLEVLKYHEDKALSSNSIKLYEDYSNQFDYIDYLNEDNVFIKFSEIESKKNSQGEILQSDELDMDITINQSFFSKQVVWSKVVDNYILILTLLFLFPFLYYIKFLIK